MVRSKAMIKGIAFAFVFLFLLGFVYPTISAEITQVVIPYQSEGSPVVINGTIYGSYLLSDAFNASYFFQPRPSAENNYPLDSNATLNQTERYIAQFRAENPTINLSQIPYAMVAYSASGQDPNIPILGAYDQVQRIALAIEDLVVNNSRSVPIQSIYTLLNKSIQNAEQRNFPIFGSYYVNTVTLNVEIIHYLTAIDVLPPNIIS